MANILEIIQKYLNVIENETFPRYKSWDYCFKAFSFPQKNEVHSLHLTAYLASWGMYRGSGGLLQKDYKVHDIAVDILFQAEYLNLKCNVQNETSEDDIDEIIDLKDKLVEYYSSISYKRGLNPAIGITATDTLTSKIILGTYGCVPAFDQYFINGLKHLKFKKTGFNKSSLKEIFQFIIKHQKEFTKAQDLIKKQTNIHYPIMKIVDMYFWQIGYDLALKDEKEKKDKKLAESLF